MNNRKDNLAKTDKLELMAHELLGGRGATHGLNRALRLLLKETKLYKNHIQGKNRVKNQEKISRLKKIQIGGGKHVLQGFLNIDAAPPADIIFDVREGLPVKSDYADLIFSEHFLEHIDYPVSAKKFIKECHRVLRKGGKLILGVPDSELVILNYIKKNKRFWKLMLDKWYLKRNCLDHFNTYIDLVNYHFRDQDDDSKYSPHYWAYDFEKLKSLVKDAGFARIKRWKFDKFIANPQREWGSVYIEAVKI